jgi:hypothetical protein
MGNEEQPGVTFLGVESGDELWAMSLRLGRCRTKSRESATKRLCRLTSGGSSAIGTRMTHIAIVVTTAALRCIVSAVVARSPGTGTTAHRGRVHGLHGKVIRGRRPSKGNGKVIQYP